MVNPDVPVTCSAALAAIGTMISGAGSLVQRFAASPKGNAAGQPQKVLDR